MSKYLERADELRKSDDKYYNCAQSVLIPFSEEAGLDEEIAYRMASGFGSGMKCGSVCGAITGGVMVLGLFGLDSSANLVHLFQSVRAAHEDHINCSDLLALNAKNGGDKAEHCDNMVFEVIRLIEEIKDKEGSN